MADPFSTTYEGAFKAGTSLGQGIEDASGKFADAMKVNQQRKMAHDLLKQTGQLTEEVQEPSIDDLKKNLQDFGKKNNRQVNYTTNPNASEDEVKSQLLNMHQMYGIPLPQKPIKTTLNLTPGTEYSPYSGELKMTGKEKTKTLPEQIQEYQTAQKLLETSGLSDKADVTVGSKGQSTVKPKSQASMNASKVDNQAKIIVDGMQKGDLPPVLTNMGRTAGLSAAVEVEAEKRGYNLKGAQADWMIDQVGAKNLSKFHAGLDFAHSRFDKVRKYALTVANEINDDNAPIIRRAFISGEKELAGNPEAARVYAALYPVALEYSRLVTSNGISGQSITDSAREEGLKLVDFGLNNKQLEGLIGDNGVLTKDASFSMDAADEALNRATNKMKGSKADQILKTTGLQGNFDEDKVSQYMKKYPNRSREEIIRAMQQ